MRAFTFPSVLTRLAPALAVGLLAACGGGGGGGGGGDDVGPDTNPDVIECTAGENGCECLEDDTCNEGLVCDEGVCVEESTCTPGDTGCECLGDGTCTDAGDECQDDNVCRPRTECTGELACACGEGDTCDEGLTCEDGTCTVANGVIVTLAGGDARACDILIDTPDRMTAEVVFPAGVRGRHRARGARTALSLIRTNDTALTGAVAGVVFTGEDAAAEGDVGAISATCYDRLGNPVTDVTPTAE